jgi:hypothetical protein
VPADAEISVVPQLVGMKINGWYRATSVVLGLAGLGAGGAAVFITHVEAGPVALLVVGLLLLMIGMAGRLPSRIKVGDNEAEWKAAAFDRIVDEIEDSPGDVKPALLDALAAIEDAMPSTASSTIGAFIYQATISDMLQQYVTEANTVEEDQLAFEPSETQRGFDGLLIGPLRTVGVEIKSSKKGFGRQLIYEVAGRLSAAASPGGPNAVLLVTRGPLARSAQLEALQFENFYIAQVVDAGDKEILERAARAALGLDESGRYFRS